MGRCSLASALLLLAVGLAWGQRGQPPMHVAPTDPLPAREQLKRFHVPTGFEIQLVAAEPDINKPINIAFDAKGRLWVTGSVEYPFPAKGVGRDKVWILDDFDDDGRARKITTFADGLNIPIGVLPTSKGAIVYSIPSIYHMTDENGDGKADKREVLFTGYGYADTHGMTGEFMLGFDGWIYACHGFANASKVRDRTGKVRIEMHSGNTYRFKPDGTGIEYFTHGQVNPFGLAWDGAGNLFSCDCHSRPVYQLLRGGWYPSFQKPHDGLGFAPEMMKHSHHSTGIAGIALSEDERWPADWRGNVFIGNVITNRINRDKIVWRGATPQAVEMPDLVACDDPWFRPVDIKLGPDGALYVADFYNRIIGHYEVPLDHPGRDRERGRIWRIVYRGDDGLSPVPKREDLTALGTADLVSRLRHGNLTVRMQAMNVLVDRGPYKVLREVNKLLDQSLQAEGLWVLERLARLDRARLVPASLADRTLLRVHAQRILAERGRSAWEERDLVLRGLDDADARVRRAAVQALARQPHPDNVPLLLRMWHAADHQDTHLVHAIRMALRDQLQLGDSWAKVAQPEEKDSRAVADICPGSRTAESAAFLFQHLVRYRENKDNWTRFAKHIARYAPPAPRPYDPKPDDAGYQVMTLIQQTAPNDLGLQASVFKAVFQGFQERGGRPAEAARNLCETFTRRLLASPSGGDQQAGVELASQVKLPSLSNSLLSLARNQSTAESVRKGALQALAASSPGEHLDAVAGLVNNAHEPFAVREQAAQVLAAGNPPDGQALLLKALAGAPARLEKAIALALASSRDGADKLLDAVAQGKASARLLQDAALVGRLREAKVPALKERLAKLTAGLPPADQRIQELLAKRRDSFLLAKADSVMGAKVFEKQCANCHQLNNQGTKIGPQLDGIGSRGLERLLEDILDPSRNVDQAFRSTTLSMKNGQFHSGLLLRQEGKVLVLADAQGKELRIEDEAVEARTLSPLSPMPANFAEQIAANDFHHLLAFLLSQTAKKE